MKRVGPMSCGYVRYKRGSSSSVVKLTPRGEYTLVWYCMACFIPKAPGHEGGTSHCTHCSGQTPSAAYLSMEESRREAVKPLNRAHEKLKVAWELLRSAGRVEGPRRPGLLGAMVGVYPPRHSSPYAFVNVHGIKWGAPTEESEGPLAIDATRIDHLMRERFGPRMTQYRLEPRHRLLLNALGDAANIPAVDVVRRLYNELLGNSMRATGLTEATEAEYEEMVAGFKPVVGESDV